MAVHGDTFSWHLLEEDQMDWNAIIALVVIAWVLIGAFHAVENWMEFNASVHNWVWDEANLESLPKNISFPRNALNRGIIRNSEGPQLQDAVFTLILGPIGIVLAGMDWLVRNWPESLVLGGEPAKPAATATPTITTDDVNLEPLRQRAGLPAGVQTKAGIFNNK